MLGEKASEARNKFYKRDRLEHTRQFNRQANLEDMFFRAIDSSDPVIANFSLRLKLRTKTEISYAEEIGDLSTVRNLFAITKMQNLLKACKQMRIWSFQNPKMKNKCTEKRNNEINK